MLIMEHTDFLDRMDFKVEEVSMVFTVEDLPAEDFTVDHFSL